MEPEEYDALCEEITELLYDLQDGRTGKPVVKHVAKTRKFPTDDDPKLPDADLVVLWDQPATDVVDSSQLGRVGPLTHCRAGGHRGEGFLMAKGPGIVPGSDLPKGEVVDLPPTILNLMNAPLPDYFEGKPLIKI